MAKQRGDGGYTLIELLLVIVVLGLMATVVVAAAGGFTAEAEDVACKSEAQALYTATEAFFAQRPATALPSIGDPDDENRFERGLVDTGFLRSPSDLYNLDALGHLTAADSRCAG